MSKSKLLFTVAVMTVIAAAAAVPAANAQVVHFIGAGSSALYTPIELAAVNDVGWNVAECGNKKANVINTQAGNPAGTCNIYHWSVKTSCPATCVAQLVDTRTNPSIGPIPDEPANIWVVWTTNAANTAVSDIWTGWSVDSTVGVRTSLSRPSGGAAGTSAVKTLLAAGSNNAVDNASPALLNSGVASGLGTCAAGVNTCDTASLPANVAAAINGQYLTAGLTDIRPEDAKYATKRAAGPVSNGSGLGYGTIGSQLVTESIQSHYSSTIATPVEFGVIGSNDPITLASVPNTIEVVPVGESPVVFIANRSNAAGLGATVAALTPAFADLEDSKGALGNPLSGLFSGNDCSGENAAFEDTAGAASLTAAGIANFNINLAQREPLSGTMNTTEFSEFRTSGTTNVIPGSGTAVWNSSPYAYVSGAQGGSQEFNVDLTKANTNPLDTPCAKGGNRTRAIGTGEMVNTAIFSNADTLGYAFFGFSNVAKVANQAAYGYLTIDQVDPIFNDYNGTGGDPGQPADSTGANKTNGGQEWGVLPVCTPGGSATVPNCTEGAIWKGGVAFPHIQDGTYRAWSLLRMLCDTANAHCTAASDTVGAEALVAALQADIVAGTGVPDFLPFSQASVIRSHYDAKQFSNYEKGVPFAHFVDNGTTVPAAGSLDIPETTVTPALTAPGESAEGGDAGGCIVPLGSGNTVQISSIVYVAAAGGNPTLLHVISSTIPLPAGIAAGQPVYLDGTTNSTYNNGYEIWTGAGSVNTAAGKFYVVANASDNTAGAGAGGYASTFTNCFQ